MSTPLGQPGPLTDMERYLFGVTGYLVVPGALSPDETEACLAAAQRCHAPYPRGEWRQLGHTYEREPALEALIDHPSILPKVRGLLGDHFYLQSSWCTVQPSGGKGGGFHQDGSSCYEFRKLGTPTPLIQLRVGYYLTDQSRERMGNLVLIPGSHNAALVPPRVPGDEDRVPIRDVVRGAPGTAVMFHQGVFHCPAGNDMEFDRYTMHMVYAPPWLITSDRQRNDPAFLARTTPLRRALLGEWTRPEQPFGVDYQAPPFDEQ
jgi:ectoine hydroxylase